MGAELVIFDCDGVLVDSEPLAIIELCALLEDAGAPMSRDEAYRRFLGRSTSSLVEEVARDFDVEITAGHLAAMRARLHARLEQDLRPIAHVGAAAQALGLPVCVASSSSPERIRLSLARTGLLEIFDTRIYSASMVKHGKPAPDLFLHAAASMGAAPEACVVVEDSPAGLTAAQAAGMKALAFCGGGHAGPGQLRARAEALAPDAIFDDMRDLPGLVATLFPGGAQPS